MTIKDNIETEADALALQIAREAQGDGIDLPIRVDALKAITGYRVGDSKVKKPDDAKGVGSFKGVRDRIQQLKGAHTDSSVNGQNGRYKPTVLE